MRQKLIRLFLLISLVVPMHRAVADDAQNNLDIKALNEQLNHALVFIDSDARASILALENILPDYSWSVLFKSLCKDLRVEGNVALYDHVELIVNECLAVCGTVSNDKFRGIQASLEAYKKTLLAGKAHLDALEDSEIGQTRGHCSKTKKSANCALTVYR